MMDDSLEDEDIIPLHSDTCMLKDVDRNSKYRAALAAVVTPDSHVLDIGAGTGLLSMISTKLGAASVHTCEMYPPMAEIAQRTLEANDMSSIKLHTCSSNDLVLGNDLEHQPNVVVSEIVDSELLGEGMLPSIRHIVQEIADPSAIFVPYRAEVVVQLVECSELQKWHSLNGCDIGNITLSQAACLGQGQLHDVQVDRLPDLIPLSEPTISSDISLDRNILPDTVHHEASHLVPNRSGVASALVVWWRLHLCDDIIIDTAPGWVNPQAFFREHWMPCVYLLAHPTPVDVGQNIPLQTYHDDYCYWFTLDSDDLLTAQPACSCGVHNSLDRFGLRQLHDQQYTEHLRALQQRYANTTRSCLIRSVSVGMVLYALQASWQQVYFEPLAPALARVVTALLEPYPNLLAKLTIDTRDVPEDALILQDPILSQHPNVLDWLCSTQPDLIYPVQARLTVQLVSLPDLSQIAHPVKQACGFDMAAYDSSAFQQLPIVTTQSLWEYQHTLLSAATPLCTVPLPLESGSSMFETALKVSGNGQAHALVLHIELGDQRDDALWFGTPQCSTASYKGVIVMLPATMDVEAGGSLCVSLQLTIAAHGASITDLIVERADNN
eukprot:m.92778 g.92778  ORF g.92778 m.92778 type:complete len:609 (-) comp14964_c0_seq1:15-1841(-)